MHRALTVGISDYGWLNQNLPGCGTDRAEWAAYLRSKLALGDDSLRTLADRAATREAILDGVNWILSDASPNDERVIFFAGHGARMRRVPASGGPAVVEETLVASPGAQQSDYARFMIFDEDLAAIIDSSGFPASARLTLIFDSCHSGGMLRNVLMQGVGGEAFEGPLPRALNLPEELQVFSASVSPFSRTLSALARTGAGTPRLLVAAARAEESAWDDAMEDGQRHGAFSYYCVQELIRAPGRPLSEVMSGVSTLIHRKFQQSPQLLGDPGRFTKPLFQA